MVGMAPRESLPIDAVLPELTAALQRSGNVVLQAPTGAGKTTRVPPAVLNDSGQVVLLQPRRVAARSVARRMAVELNGRVGDLVGYQVRFDSQVSARTRIVVMTEGILVRRLMDDPFLEGISTVLFDEFHERHLDTDLALGMVRRVQQTVRPDLRIVVMSATLDPLPIAEYLGNAEIVRCQVPRFPVAIEYRPPADLPRPAELAVRGVRELLSRIRGDLLVFLPGAGEIQQALERLTSESPELEILPLYGELSADEQDRIFAPATSRRVILATNIAETSLTIPGIEGVVDTGLARQLHYDADLGLNRLELSPIAKSAADQRSGRAGRLGPGLCLRMWSEASQRIRPEHEVPEIQRTDLAGVVLQLLSWGEANVREFPWFEPPPEPALQRAELLLALLDATADGAITPQGQQLVAWPVHPRLARLLHDGAGAGVARLAALGAALLSERPPLRREEGRRVARHESPSDLLDLIDAVEQFARTGQTESNVGSLAVGPARAVLETAGQLERLAREQSSKSHHSGSSTALLRALLAAFPDRLARRREPGSRRALMTGGRGVVLADSSAVRESELLLCLDLDSSGAEALVRRASAVQRDWLPGQHLTTRIDVEFDPAAERLQARRRVYWLDLVLEESPTALPEGEETAQVLASAARRQWERVFPRDNLSLQQFLARLACLRDWLPQLELPAWSEKDLQELLPELAVGCRTFDELQKAPWLDVVQSRLDPTQRQQLDREAPERLLVPSGSRLALTYEAGRPPVLAVRIQEIFGWKATPRIAGGRIPVLLHLLAPNHRPQQITDDLASFWKNAYPLVRGELRRRYPKHAWPDDPYAAIAEKRPQRRTGS